MQSASLAQDVKAGAQIEVVGVAQDDLGLHLLAQFREMHTFHRTHRTDGHEDGGAYLAVVSLNQTCTGV